MNFCSNCGSEKIEKYGLDENGGMYRCLMCKEHFSVKIYKDGNYIKINKEKS